MGARMSMNRPPPSIPRRPLRLPPPKMLAKRAVCASRVIAPASVAAIELVRMSRFLNAQFVGEHALQFLVIQQIENTLGDATAACWGLRPVANALGESLGMT